MPQRRPGLRGCRKETTLPSLTGELTVAGFNRGGLKSAMEFLLEIIIKVRGSSLNTRLRCSQTHASTFSLKKIDDRARWLPEPAKFRLKKSQISQRFFVRIARKLPKTNSQDKSQAFDFRVAVLLNHP